MDFLKNLKLDTWWGVVLYLGIGAVVASFYFNIDFIEEKHLCGLGIGMFLVGLSFFMAQKSFSMIKPANAYTGGAGLISWKEIKHNPITSFMLIAGIILILVFIFLLTRELI